MHQNSKSSPRSIEGNLVDVLNEKIIPALITIEGGKIQAIKQLEHTDGPYILPGLIDAHVHVESSMLIPSEFARLAVVHGTVGTVSDPHEIANVMGNEGVRYMIDNGKQVPFYYNFGVPSCVPATPFETAGAVLDSNSVAEWLKSPEVNYLSEMMNYPGVLNNDSEVMAKIQAAHDLNKTVDGHAPGLKGKDAEAYAKAGISTDHECFTREEALDKLKHGMKIIIREGSAAKNFEALIDLLPDYPDKIMFCSDDKHPDDLIKGHINQLVSRAIHRGIEPMQAIKAATLNPVKHYNLKTGLLQEGDPASFIKVDNLQDFNILQTYIDGSLVAEEGTTKIPHVQAKAINQFNKQPIKKQDLKVNATNNRVNTIIAEEGQLVTKRATHQTKIIDNCAYSNPDEDVLKLVLVNRYQEAKPAVGFIKGFGFKEGAIASTVAHDSHNILAVGVDDASITRAINKIIEFEGGVSITGSDFEDILPLPVAGLMSNEDGYEVAHAYESIDEKAKQIGSELSAPFMTLSFMALLVIPELKLSDLGLFDGTKFEFTPLFSG